MKLSTLVLFFALVGASALVCALPILTRFEFEEFHMIHRSNGEPVTFREYQKEVRRKDANIANGLEPYKPQDTNYLLSAHDRNELIIAQLGPIGDPERRAFLKQQRQERDQAVSNGLIPYKHVDMTHFYSRKEIEAYVRTLLEAHEDWMFPIPDREPSPSSGRSNSLLRPPNGQEHYAALHTGRPRQELSGPHGYGTPTSVRSHSKSGPVLQTPSTQIHSLHQILEGNHDPRAAHGPPWPQDGSRSTHPPPPYTSHHFPQNPSSAQVNSHWQGGSSSGNHLSPSSVGSPYSEPHFAPVSSQPDNYYPSPPYHPSGPPLSPPFAPGGSYDSGAQGSPHPSGFHSSYTPVHRPAPYSPYTAGGFSSQPLNPYAPQGGPSFKSHNHPFSPGGSSATGGISPVPPVISQRPPPGHFPTPALSPLPLSIYALPGPHLMPAGSAPWAGSTYNSPAPVPPGGFSPHSPATHNTYFFSPNPFIPPVPPPYSATDSSAYPSSQSTYHNNHGFS